MGAEPQAPRNLESCDALTHRQHAFRGDLDLCEVEGRRSRRMIMNEFGARPCKEWVWVKVGSLNPKP